MDEDAGHLTIRPKGIREVARSYRTESLVLETHLVCEEGEAILTDALAMGDGVRGHDLGRESPHMLLRHACCVKGEVDIEIEFVPRTEYGLSTPIVSRVDGGLIAKSGPVTLVLHTDVDLEINESRDRAWRTAKLRPGDDVSFAVTYNSSWQSAPPPVDAGSVPEAIDDDSVALGQPWQRARVTVRSTSVARTTIRFFATGCSRCGPSTCGILRSSGIAGRRRRFWPV